MTIYLVTGDTMRTIDVALFDPTTGRGRDPATWEKIDISSNHVSVRALFSPKGSENAVLSLTGKKIDPSKGLVRFDFGQTGVTMAPGKYDMQVEINEGGKTYTINSITRVIVQGRIQ